MYGKNYAKIEGILGKNYTRTEEILDKTLKRKKIAPYKICNKVIFNHPKEYVTR